MSGNTFESPSDTDPTATQNVESEQAVDVRVMATGERPLGSSAGTGAWVGVHGEDVGACSTAAETGVVPTDSTMAIATVKIMQRTVAIPTMERIRGVVIDGPAR